MGKKTPPAATRQSFPNACAARGQFTRLLLVAAADNISIGCVGCRGREATREEAAGLGRRSRKGVQNALLDFLGLGYIYCEAGGRGRLRVHIPCREQQIFHPSKNTHLKVVFVIKEECTACIADGPQIRLRFYSGHGTVYRIVEQMCILTSLTYNSVLVTAPIAPNLVRLSRSLHETVIQPRI